MRAATEERFAPGTMLLRQYRVVEKLGQGGMGAVYRARDDVSGQEVAVKVLPAGLARDPHLRERFVQEAQALASLDHPAIVPLVTFARNDDDHYLVMKYVAGRSLESVIAQQGALPVEVVRDIFRALLEALAYAHDRGVIHRDIKPANVLLDENGKVLLVDFGIARRETSTRLTETGILMGTPQYMSPEQIQGRGAERHSDLYAAGLLLFEMLTGRPPFVGIEVFTLLRHHVESPVPDPTSLRGGDIPAPLLVTVEALLRKNPAHRPANAQAALALMDAPVTSLPRFADDDKVTVALHSNLHTPLTVAPKDRRSSEDTDALLQPFRRRRRVPVVGLAALVLVAAGGTWLALVEGETWSSDDREQLASAPLPPPNPREAAFTLLLRSADEHLKSRTPKRAIGVLDAALLERPDDKTAWLLMTRALIEAKRGEEAARWMERLDQRRDLEPFEQELVENYREHLPRRRRRVHIHGRGAA
ncbi:MAG: protein kinase domain-containing protein, partial [Myxococcota bacterium]